MNLPKTELFPDDPDHLPPARRRRAKRLLAPLDADERAAFLDQLARRTTPSIDFFLFSLLSGIVLSAGVLLNSPALILLGALLAPLLAPAIGLAFGTTIGSVRFFFQSLVALLIGCGFALAMGAAAVYLLPYVTPIDFTLAHSLIQLAWPDFLVLFFGTVLASAGLAKAERRPTLGRVASVALAYEYYLPLVIAGVGLISGEPHLFPEGLLVFAIRLAWGSLFSAFTLAILGFRPLTLFGYTFSGAITLLGVILVIGISGASVIFSDKNIVVLPTQSPTPTNTITVTPTTTSTPVPPTSTRPPTLTPTWTQTPTPDFTPTPTPVYAYVSARSGDGAILRASPGFDGKFIRSYLNGSLMVVLPDSQIVSGDIWAHVKAPDGTEGWMLQSLLLMATPAPTW